MKKTNIDSYDEILPSTKRTTRSTKRPLKSEVEEEKKPRTRVKKEETEKTVKTTRTTKKKPTIIIDDKALEEAKEVKKTTTKTKVKKEAIISEEEEEFSRVKTRGAKRQKDKRLESLIAEINKDHRVPEIEVLDLPVRTKKYYDDEVEDFLINTKKDDDEEELLLNEKKEDKTIVIPKVTKKDVKKILEEKEEKKAPKTVKKVSTVNETPKKVVKTKKKKKKKYRVRKKALIVLLLLLLVFVGGTVFVVHKIKEHNREVAERIRIENHIKDIKAHYDAQVKVNKDALIYKKVNNNYQVSGTIYKDNIIKLEELKIDKDTEYFYNKDLDAYIKYTDVDPNSDEIVKDDRYKKYIPFNESIVTNDDYIIYHNDDSKMYKLSESTEYPIIVKEKDRYYFDYQDELAYILKEDVKEIAKRDNTKLKNVSSIPVLNYHFIYDPKERTCNQSICLTAAKFEEHLKYFKTNNILDLTMREFELYMNKKINLPKSVLITLDDGWLRQKAVEVLDKNEMHATIFLITSSYLPIESKYVEFHSHTHNMHTPGQCSTGQGGGIQCLSESKIQADLAKSRELLNNTTYFCYPFYEWNEYAISQLKKAGFTMAFIGGQRAAKPSDNIYRVPRYIIYSWTTVNNIKQYFN